jgi:hypothetical protein
VYIYNLEFFRFSIGKSCLKGERRIAVSLLKVFLSRDTTLRISSAYLDPLPTHSQYQASISEIGTHAENDFTGYSIFMKAANVAKPPPDTPIICTSSGLALVCFNAY